MASAIKSPVPRKLLVLVLALALVLVLGVVDYVTGREIAITSFYLVPICWASWVAGRQAGLALALAATCARLTADVMAEYNYSHPAIPYWNALMLLVLFALVVYLLTAFHDAHLYLEDTVAHRTAALREEIAERKRLEASKIRAERLAVVGTMAAEVAHEVRNPLGAMVLNLDRIQTEIDTLAATNGHAPDEGARLVDGMRAEVERIHQVLEDYLRFAPAQAAKTSRGGERIARSKTGIHGKHLRAGGGRTGHQLRSVIRDRERRSRTTVAGNPEPHPQRHRCHAGGRRDHRQHLARRPRGAHQRGGYGRGHDR